jgi:hypothetical protein
VRSRLLDRHVTPVYGCDSFLSFFLSGVGPQKLFRAADEINHSCCRSPRPSPPLISASAPRSTHPLIKFLLIAGIRQSHAHDASIDLKSARGNETNNKFTAASSIKPRLLKIITRF